MTTTQQKHQLINAWVDASIKTLNNGTLLSGGAAILTPPLNNENILHIAGFNLSEYIHHYKSEAAEVMCALLTLEVMPQWRLNKLMTDNKHAQGLLRTVQKDIHRRLKITGAYAQKIKQPKEQYFLNMGHEKRLKIHKETPVHYDRIYRALEKHPFVEIYYTKDKRLAPTEKITNMRLAHHFSRASSKSFAEMICCRGDLSVNKKNMVSLDLELSYLNVKPNVIPRTLDLSFL